MAGALVRCAFVKAIWEWPDGKESVLAAAGSVNLDELFVAVCSHLISCLAVSVPQSSLHCLF